MERLTLKGEEECSHASYDLVLNILDKDIFDLFRAGKIRNQKTGIDVAKARKGDQLALIIKDKQNEFVCSTATELETINALQRRTLARGGLWISCNEFISFRVLRAHPPGTSSGMWLV